jgi:hypothetical protein
MSLLDRVAARTRPLLLAALLPVLGACPESPGLAPYPSGFAGAPFSQADVAGTWRYAAIFQGAGVAAGTSRGWERGTLSVAGGGGVTVLSAAASDGTTSSTAPTQWTIDANGFVTTPPGSYVGFNLKVNANRTVAAATGTHGIGAASAGALWVLERVGAAAFSGADLAASTWVYHRLTTGSAPAWEHGVASFDPDLLLTATGRVSSGGAQPDRSLGRASVDAEGNVTLEGDPTWLGGLSGDKKLLVATRGGGTEFALEVYVRTGQSFALADVLGRHSAHMLLASPSGWGWSHGVYVVNDQASMAWESVLTNAGQTTLPPPVDILVAPDGTVTAPGLPTLHSTQLFSKDGSARTVTSGVYASFSLNLR